MANINGDNFNNFLVGGFGNDSISGFDGNDTLDGNGVTFNNNELDTLTGGLGSDTFVLGDLIDAYYLDSFGFGENSYATITDFFAVEGDRIEVFGNRADYQLEPFQGGIDILYQGDLIAYVENTTDVNLNRDFIFLSNSTGDILIDPAQYLASNPDLILSFNTQPYQQALDAAKQHYIDFGINEGRPLDTFEEAQYLASNPDLILSFNTQPYQQALDSATAHYIVNGYFEGRPLDTFNANSYLNNNPDLVAPLGNDFNAATQHFIEFGYFEGRIFV
ncbi:MAG: hypothetical protein ACFBSE_21080 [Prochloraceae cyanobacterium]